MTQGQGLPFPLVSKRGTHPNNLKEGHDMECPKVKARGILIRQTVISSNNNNISVH